MIYKFKLTEQEVVGQEVVILTPIEEFVEECLSNVAEQAVHDVSLQGGYYNASDPYYIFGFAAIPYYLYDNISYVPTTKTIESELGFYVDFNINDCLNEFASFAEQGYEITTTEPNTKVTVGDSDISFRLNYPITISMADTTSTYSIFTTDVDSQFNYHYETAGEIIALHNDDSSIPMSRINNLLEEKDLYVDINHMNGTVIYILQSVIDENTIELYQFATYYHWGGSEDE